MTPVLHFAKSLAFEPITRDVPGLEIRPFRDEADVDAWLALREAAFAGLVKSARPWTQADFRREFTGKPWWSPEHCWFATLSESNLTVDSPGMGSPIAGSVVLGRSGRPPDDEACVMWLMVHPTWRRRGVGRALLTILEQAVWNAGEQRIVLETHRNWRDAVQLYQQCGYAPL
jgi:GNAT superfamily N-acetyltransferase